MRSSWNWRDRPRRCPALCGASPCHVHIAPYHPSRRLRSVQKIEHRFGVRLRLLDVRNMRGIEAGKFGALDLFLDGFAADGGVAGSCLPTMTRVGTEMREFDGVKSMSRIASQQAI